MAMKHDEPVSQVEILSEIARTLAAVQAQASGGANIGAALEKITETLAGVAHRQRPENPEHNRISHFNPQGLSEQERPQLKCRMTWVGHPLTVDILRFDEIEALNTLEPGEYRVTKANGNTVPFTVTAKRNEGGRITELHIQFPHKGDQAHDHRSMVEYCREATGAKVPTVEELMRQVRELTESNRTLKAVVEAA